jgi:hypothetical protein
MREAPGVSPRDCVAEVPASTLHGDERGQVTIIVVFGALAFILLVAFIYNTAARTSRKVEMQGAADSAAVSAGVWTARGMNLMVLNNNTMVEVLSIMISVRAIVQMKQIQRAILTYISPVPIIGQVAQGELTAPGIGVHFTLGIWEPIDNTLNNRGSGLGWKALNLLDGMNRVIKGATPPLAVAEAFYYARRNGADLAVLMPGNALLVPTLPVTRGPKELLVDQAEECPLRFYGFENMFGRLRLAVKAFSISGPLTAILATAYADSRINANIRSLRGGNRILEILDRFSIDLEDFVMTYIEGVMFKRKLTFLEKIPIYVVLGPLLLAPIPILPPMTGNLRWSGDPRPMVLTDSPDEATTEETDFDGAKVHEYLQLMAVATAGDNRGSPMGGEKYPNMNTLPWITYAQASVYNPSRWDKFAMFSQDWRAKLVRARLLDEKCRSVEEMIGPVGGSDFSLCAGWSFVNTH